MKLFYKDSCRLNFNEIQKTAESLYPFIDKLKEISFSQKYDTSEAFINLPFDENILKSTQNIKKDLINSSLKYIIVIGIGGSNLGTKAVYDALFGYYEILEPNRFPKFIFLDTINPLFLDKLNNLLHTLTPEQVVINFVSKSGGTSETITNLEVLIANNPDFKKRLVVTTKAGSEIHKAAHRNNLAILEIPEEIAGRFSVFSTVGIFPLSFAQISIVELLSGAMEIRQLCLEKSPEKNTALLSAVITYLSKQPINVSFFFDPELESLGKWYRQLMAESLGKTLEASTPSIAVGTTDLHSILQLYLGGPANKYTTFVYSNKNGSAHRVPQKRLFPQVTPEITNKSTSEISEAIYLGVKDSYLEKQLPFSEIELSALNEKTVAKFMQFKMMEILFLSKLYNVNTFDQPQVEKYKETTKKILGKNEA